MPGEKEKPKELALSSFLLTHLPPPGQAEPSWLHSLTPHLCVGTLVSEGSHGCCQWDHKAHFFAHPLAWRGREGAREKQCCTTFTPTQKYEHLTSHKSALCLWPQGRVSLRNLQATSGVALGHRRTNNVSAACIPTTGGWRLRSCSRGKDSSSLLHCTEYHTCFCKEFQVPFAGLL